jgi:hypothetical protein
MQPTGVVFLKVLLNKYALGGNEALLKFLPKPEIDAVLKVLTTSQDIAAGITWPHEIFSRMHYSWIAPLVQNLPPSIQKATLASLPEVPSSKLKKMLGIKSNLKIHSDQMKHFWLNRLYSQWKPIEGIPIQYLDASVLTPLLALSKEDLVLLIDLLSLNDLAEAIRHIVDKNTLTTIYSNLNQTEQSYLRICLHQRDKLTIPKIEVNKLKNSPEELKKALHKRGLLRLGKALCGQSREFLWHLTHILDTGRGTTLQEYYAEQPITGVTAMLVQQTVAATNFINES